MGIGIVIIIFGIFGIITALVLVVVGLSGTSKKLTIIGVVVFLVSLTGLLLSVFFSVRTVVRGIKGKVEYGMAQLDSSNKVLEKKMAEPEDDWNNDTQNEKNKEIIQSLKKAVNGKERLFVKKRFFNQFYGENYARYPLTFPLAIHKNSDIKNNWELVDERGTMDTRLLQTKNTSLVLNVTHLVFDEKMILLKADFSTNNTLITKYFLFEFGKTGVFYFNSESELMRMATNIGYKGSFDFYTTQEYADLFDLDD